MSNPTCSERIAKQMQSMNETLEELYDKINQFEDSEVNEEGMDEYINLPLSIETFKIIKVLFSTGGPADWIEIKVDEDDGEVIDVDYHFSDWFDHAQVKVEKNSYLWQYAEERAELERN
jgi:hypothetical protein